MNSLYYHLKWASIKNFLNFCAVNEFPSLWLVNNNKLKSIISLEEIIIQTFRFFRHIRRILTFRPYLSSKVWHTNRLCCCFLLIFRANIRLFIETIQQNLLLILLRLLLWFWNLQLSLFWKILNFFLQIRWFALLPDSSILLLTKGRRAILAGSNIFLLLQKYLTFLALNLLDVMLNLPRIGKWISACLDEII